jgi:hypothetical protein
MLKDDLMFRCSREFSLEDALSDSLVMAVMEADHVDPQELRETLTSVARTLARPRGATAVERCCNPG